MEGQFHLLNVFAAGQSQFRKDDRPEHAKSYRRVATPDVFSITQGHDSQKVLFKPSRRNGRLGHGKEEARAAPTGRTERPAPYDRNPAWAGGRWIAATKSR